MNLRRYDVKTERKARALAARVTAAIAGADTFEEWAPLVVAACRGCGGAVWLCYDDAGGSAHSWTKPQFHKVRQVRNSPTWGPMLFDAINEGKP